VARERLVDEISAVQEGLLILDLACALSRCQSFAQSALSGQEAVNVSLDKSAKGMMKNFKWPQVFVCHFWPR